MPSRRSHVPGSADRRCPFGVAAFTMTALVLSAPSRAITDAPIMYADDRTAASTIHDRDPAYKPMYLVYVDRQRTVDDVRKLVEDLGLAEHLQEYKTRLYVVGPRNRQAYDSESADWTEYANPTPGKDLQRVVVSKRDDSRETLAQQGWSELGGTRAMVGTVSNSEGVDDEVRRSGSLRSDRESAAHQGAVTLL